MKKGKRICILICSIGIVMFTACQTKETGGCIVAGRYIPLAADPEQEPETYRFVDVYGEEYEAELLEDVSGCAYDYGRLTERKGFKYYLDEAGNISSRLGIDVSMFQPDIDWKAVRDSGIEFVIIRLGYRGYGDEGKLVEDECFRKHMEGALKAGLDVGVYFFSQALDEKETLEEAQFVLDRIKDYPISAPVVFDTEEIKYDTARTDKLSGEQFTENCIVFCNAVKKAGYDSMIYANMKWLAFTLDLRALSAYNIWYADYEDIPQNPYDFSMWQYTEKGKVPGVEGNVDINVWFGKR